MVTKPRGDTWAVAVMHPANPCRPIGRATGRSGVFSAAHSVYPISIDVPAQALDTWTGRRSWSPPV